jgi:hypothetical protein
LDQIILAGPLFKNSIFLDKELQLESISKPPGEGMGFIGVQVRPFSHIDKLATESLLKQGFVDEARSYLIIFLEEISMKEHQIINLWATKRSFNCQM